MVDIWRWVVRLFAADDPETGWLIRLLTTGFLGWTLATARPVEAAGWVVGLLAASFTCWLAFLALDRRTPRAALGLLATGAVLAASAAGPGDSAAVVFLVAFQLMFASDLRPRLRTLLALGLLDAAVAVAGMVLWGRAPGAITLYLALLAICLLLALHRRQHRMQALQTRLLLEQTRRAQHESARAAAMEERARIAREIHDVLAHSLGALGVQLELAEALLAEKDDRQGAVARLRRSRRLAAEGLREARAAVAALRADVPELGQALATLAGEHRDHHGTPVSVRVEGTPRRLSSPAEVSLLRTAREALTNAARHAPGAPIDVALSFRGRCVRLSVANATPGTPVRERETAVAGFGLAGMGERIALVGGTLRAGADAPGQGWTVTAEVPA
ncbi:sensor histidine kinase [Streptosporangium amethystogenes subsp. fukuiense]|uniref:histidine kinase n=1 Tax=Streptosporangium amethystogenes subsp. fukuiense TaxID=698418 RepID=A0ABW2T2C7_9ACTN